MSLESAYLTAESQIGQERNLYVIGNTGIFVAGSVLNVLSPTAAGKVALQLRSAYEEEIFLRDMSL